jgi:parallel beta-helix repeat protein
MVGRSRRAGIAVLAAAAVVVVVLLVVFRAVGPPRWPDDAIFVPRDAATIQQALQNALPGATIVLQVQDEAFRGPVTIDVASVTLASAGDAAKLEASGSDPALRIQADGVTVRGLRITSGSIGIQIESARCTIQNVRVQDAPIGIQLLDARGCELRDIEMRGGRIGLDLVSSGGNVFDDIVVEEVAETGLKAFGSWDNVLEAVAVSDAPIGLLLEQGSSENELRGCHVERASIAGVEFRGSNDNLLVDCVIRDSGIGVALEGVTGNEIHGCKIDDIVVAGLLLQQAVRNRATENTIVVSQDVGILLSQSAENALAYNRIDECAGAGIRLDGSDGNLVIGNVLSRNVVGIQADRSSWSRVLRNTVSSSELAGFVFSGGGKNRFLDNGLSDAQFGVVLVESSENTLLRNRIEDQSVAGLCVINGSQANSIAECRISVHGVGILIAVSARSEVLNNRLHENDVGLLLASPDHETRIEGNTIRGNRIGLRQGGSLEIATGLALLGIDLLEGGEIASPVVVNNLFASNNELDVLNESEWPVYVGGNWWGVEGVRDEALAEVSDRVHLEGSAWKGTLAIGTEADVAQEILGRILQYALTDAGLRVIDLIGMGDSDRVREALRMQDVDFVWWGTSETILPKGADTEGEIDVAPIPATRRWTAVVSEEMAQRLAETTLSAFAALVRDSGGTFRYTAPRALGEAVVASFEQTYGLSESVGSANWAETLGEAEALLKFGAVEMAIVDNLEETLTFSGFVAIEDDLGVFESVGIFVASRHDLLARFPEIENVLADLIDSLTTSVIHDLVSRVRLLQRRPEAAAREHLVQQGLLAE